MRALYQLLLKFGEPFVQLKLLPFQQWMDRAELDAALSVWPVLGFAKAREQFPHFNSRSARPNAVLGILDEEVIAEIKGSAEAVESTICKMLDFLFYHLE